MDTPFGSTALALLCLTIPLLAWGDVGSIDGSAEHAVGSSSLALDSDGDGLPDDIELGGGASFLLARTIAVPAVDPPDVVAADIDCDGDMDVIATGSASAHFAWYENLEGEGIFGEERAFPLDSTTLQALLPLDVDGDCDLDILISERTNGRIAWYENVDGLGSFTTAHSIDDNGIDARTFDAGDLDGDGDLDFAAATLVPAWYENTDGMGSFVRRFIVSDVIGGTTVIDDFDQDEDLDFVVGPDFFYSDIWWVENTNGEGLFSEDHILAYHDLTRGVDSADVDGDGDPDLISARIQPDHSVGWYENTGQVGDWWTRHEVASSSAEPRRVRAADIDADGDVDLLTAWEDVDQLVWYENLDGLGSFSPAQIIPSSEADPRFLSIADLNGDGNLDVVAWVGAPGRIIWFPQADPLSPTNPDSDGDGLCDGGVTIGTCIGGWEDVNQNGVVDVGETDPRLDDTDRDGASDSWEVRSNTDPTDPLDNPFALPAIPPLGSLLTFGLLLASGVATLRKMR